MRSLTSGILRLIIVGLLALCGQRAVAQTDGRVLLVGGSSGGSSCLWATVDQFGVFSTDSGATSGSPCVYANADSYVATDAGLLAYNLLKGNTWVIRHDAIGEGSVSAGPVFSPIWAWLVAVGNYVFLYDGKSNGAIVRINPDLTVTQTYSINHVSSWTNVTATGNYLFFYNSQTGVYAVAIIDIAGRLHQTADGTTQTGFTNVAASRDTLFFYNRGSGAYQYGAIVGFSNAPGSANYDLYTGSTGSIPAGYTHLVTVNSNLLLYNVLTGAARVMVLPDSGLPVPTTQTLTLAPYWQFIVAAANHFLFYNTMTGAVTTGGVDRTGTLTVGPQVMLADGFYNVVATRQ